MLVRVLCVLQRLGDLTGFAGGWTAAWGACRGLRIEGLRSEDFGGGFFCAY